MTVELEINTFELGTDVERADKVLEEARELYTAYRMWNCGEIDMYEMMQEIGDVLTITTNFAVALGIDVQMCIDLVETKNIIRGRYD